MSARFAALRARALCHRPRGIDVSRNKPVIIYKEATKRCVPQSSILWAKGERGRESNTETFTNSMFHGAVMTPWICIYASGWMRDGESETERRLAVLVYGVFPSRCRTEERQMRWIHRRTRNSENSENIENSEARFAQPVVFPWKPFGVECSTREICGLMSAPLISLCHEYS